MASTGLHFGMYPLSIAGTPTGVAVGPPDRPEEIARALAALRGEARQVSPRNYLVYAGPDSAEKNFARADYYARTSVLGDLVIGTQDKGADLTGWLEFVRVIVARHGAALSSLQITNEPNLTFMEGANPHILLALVQGVLAAKAAARDGNLPLPIGFGSVPDTGPVVPHFWEGLAATGGAEFAASVDFVAHNFYVDVFEEPLALRDIAPATERLLRRLRAVNLAAGGIPPTVPIRIGENGWPTGKNPFTGQERPYERQAAVLEAVIRTVYALREELNITHYALFGLRDADSAEEGLFHQFGIMRDDYTPKPAFEVVKGLLKELGGRCS